MRLNGFGSNGSAHHQQPIASNRLQMVDKHRRTLARRIIETQLIVTDRRVIVTAVVTVVVIIVGLRVGFFTAALLLQPAEGGVFGGRR